MNYQAVSIATVLRDYTDVKYAGEEHRRLVDIADSLFNVGIPVDKWGDNPEYDYKELYRRYGDKFWDKVLKDIQAIDSQVDRYNVDDLEDDYAYILSEMKGEK